MSHEHARNENMKRFVFSSISAVCAQTIVQPIELIKVRMQNDIDGTHKTIKKTFKKVTFLNNYFVLWKGFIPSILREIVYSGIRFGLYFPLKNSIKQLFLINVTTYDFDELELLNANNFRIFLFKFSYSFDFFSKLFAGGISGGIGAIISNPFDLLKCQAQSTIKHVNYKTLLTRIYEENGIFGFWKGCVTTVNRAIILGSVKLTSYDIIKNKLLEIGFDKTNNYYVYIASILTGLIVAITIAPIDFARTRYMTSSMHGIKYKSGLHVLLLEHPIKWYSGFFPLWLRLGPYAIIHFTIWEKMCKYFNINTV